MAAVSVVLMVAVPLRFWGISSPFESSDQAGLANMVLYGRGVRWILAHGYGPVLPGLHKLWTEAALALGFPLTETVFRSLVALIDLAQVMVTWPLLRRLNCTRPQALAGVLCAAVLPAMVSNAHFVWNHVGIWLLMGTVSLWATLAYLDDRKPWQLGVAGAALMCHCLSSAIAIGLPLTLLILWISRWRNRAASANAANDTSPACSARAVQWWEWLGGFLLPCAGAITIILGSWLWTGGGQLGHMIAKFKLSGEGLRWHQFGYLPGVWVLLFGYFFGIVAAVGLIRATLRIRRFSMPDRRWLLALWTWCSLIPFVLIANWDRIGSPESYVIETVFCAGLLGMLLLCEGYRRLAGRPRLRAGMAALSALATGHLAFASVDSCLAGERWSRLTGVSVTWGRIWPDTGIKAAAQYIRQHVPEDAVLLSLHTTMGMEVPVAEFYTGRQMLACEDFPAGRLEELTTAMRGAVDAFIVPAENRGLMERFPEYERVCTIRRASQPLRLIYARAGSGWTHVDEDIQVLNRQYDDARAPVRPTLIRQSSASYQAAKARYKAAVARLKRSDSR